ncbi:MAG: FAD-dependent oxidoreductase, partial [Polyangiaceae bacterium]
MVPFDEPAPSLRPAPAAMPLAEGPLPSGADEFDVAILGGGVNGTGVARDLALRGLKVVLFERHD